MSFIDLLRRLYRTTDSKTPLIKLFNAFKFLSKCQRTITRTFIFVRSLEDLITLQPSNPEESRYKKGPQSLRMAEIHLLLLSAPVGSMWNESSRFFLLYPLQKNTPHETVLV